MKKIVNLGCTEVSEVCQCEISVKTREIFIMQFNLHQNFGAKFLEHMM